jgi:hypothetical protein
MKLRPKPLMAFVALELGLLFLIVSCRDALRENVPDGAQQNTEGQRHVSDAVSAVISADTNETSVNNKVNSGEAAKTEAPAPIKDEYVEYMEAGLKEYNEWKKLRNDESGNLGAVVHWQLKTSYVTRSGYVKAFVRNDYKAVVMLTSEYGNPYTDGNLVKVRDDDWLDVTGQFTRLDDEGNVVLEAMEVKNSGIK